MRSETSCIALLGAAGALTLGLGLSAAQGAPVVRGLDGQVLMQAPIPVVDAKAGVDAGGAGVAGGADAGVSAGAGDAGAGAGVDAGTDAGGGTSAGAGADVGAGADTGGSAGTGDTSADTGADAGTGAGADTGASAGTGDTNADTGADAGVDAGTDASAGAGSNDATGGTSASGDAATSGDTGADAAAAGGVGSEASTSTPADSTSSAPPAGASASIGDEASRPAATPESTPIGASATVAVPAAAPTSISPSLPVVTPGKRQGEMTVDPNRIGQTQFPAVSCVDPVTARPCPTGSGAELGARPSSDPNSMRSGVSGVSNGAAKLPAPTVVTSTRTAASAAPQPAARTSAGLGISLVDPVRKNNGLLVQGVIVNTSTQAQTVPAMQISLLNSANQVVQRSVVQAPAGTLGQGQHKTFRTLVQPLPPNTARVNVSFISTATP